MRPLSRWHAARGTGARALVVAFATVIAMVGAMAPRVGVAANTPDVTIATNDQSVIDAALGVAAQVPQEGPSPDATGDGIAVLPDPASAATADVAGGHSEVDVDTSPDALTVAQQLAHLFDGSPLVGTAPEGAFWAAFEPMYSWSYTTSDPSVGLPVAPSTSLGTVSGTRVTQRITPARRSPQARGSRATTAPSAGGAWHVAPIVTWYGPGFYGHRTACGQRYTRRIIGVAARTLPCGTLIQFRWHGMTAVAPVIDRGPYASAAYVFDWSAQLACNVFEPKSKQNICFTRFNVQWRVIRMGH